MSAPRDLNSMLFLSEALIAWYLEELPSEPFPTGPVPNRGVRLKV